MDILFGGRKRPHIRGDDEILPEYMVMLGMYFLHREVGEKMGCFSRFSTVDKTFCYVVRLVKSPLYVGVYAWPDVGKFAEFLPR